MSEQETRGANEAIDFNDELRNRREKLAALRQQGVAFPNDSGRYPSIHGRARLYGSRNPDDAGNSRWGICSPVYYPS